MAFILEFGIKGGAHTDNVIVPTSKLADKLARSLQWVLSEGTAESKWYITTEKHRRTKRECWESSTHFVSLTRAGSGVEGPASSKLWKKEQQ